MVGRAYTDTLCKPLASIYLRCAQSRQMGKDLMSCCATCLKCPQTLLRCATRPALVEKCTMSKPAGGGGGAGKATGIAGAGAGGGVGATRIAGGGAGGGACGDAEAEDEDGGGAGGDAEAEDNNDAEVLVDVVVVPEISSRRPAANQPIKMPNKTPDAQRVIWSIAARVCVHWSSCSAGASSSPRAVLTQRSIDKMPSMEGLPSTLLPLLTTIIMPPKSRLPSTAKTPASCSTMAARCFAVSARCAELVGPPACLNLNGHEGVKLNADKSH